MFSNPLAGLLVGWFARIGHRGFLDSVLLALLLLYQFLDFFLRKPFHDFSLFNSLTKVSQPYELNYWFSLKLFGDPIPMNRAVR